MVLTRQAHQTNGERKWGTPLSSESPSIPEGGHLNDLDSTL